MENFKFGDELVSMKNYCDFHQFFKDNYLKLENQVQQKGSLTKKQIKKMITEFCEKTGSKITDRQLEIFIYILDVNS